MPNIVWTLLVAAATAVVTALATGLFVTPRMEARKKRLGDVHAARDAFSAHMTRIASVCALLQQTALSRDGGLPLSASSRGPRNPPRASGGGRR
ncbi:MULTISPECIES: hypothetical protein [Streptomyces]|uniref:hypothetical protein n=1 Tax=Streptomyces TaxID=1883 RepID=UPI003444B1CE